MISKSLSTSRRFVALHDRAGDGAEFAQVLYVLLTAHADDFGRLAGDAQSVKLLTLPGSPRNFREFHDALEALDAVGLIEWYDAPDGDKCIAIKKFDDHQTGLHKRTASKFPEPPGISRKLPEIPAQLNRRELNRTEQKGTEGNRTALTRRVDDAGFLAFWDAYPKKKSKADAEKAWAKLAPGVDLVRVILAAIEQQRLSADWLKDGGQFIPYPASWLNAKRWTDEAVDVPTMSRQTLRLAQASAEFLR